MHRGLRFNKTNATISDKCVPVSNLSHKRFGFFFGLARELVRKRIIMDNYTYHLLYLVNNDRKKVSSPTTLVRSTAACITASLFSLIFAPMKEKASWRVLEAIMKVVRKTLVV